MGDDGAGNYYDYFSVTVTYECDSDVLQLQTDITDQTFNLDAASALTVLASSDTALTNSDRNTNCPYTMTCEQWDTSANTWTAISIPAYPRATCVDLTTNNDGNGNSCAAYAANPDDSSIVKCDGSADVSSGSIFTAATDCCACGGGETTCVDTDGLLTDAGGNSCADYTSSSWTSSAGATAW